MQIFFHRGELMAQPSRSVSKLIIYPKAVDGKGTIHVYDDDGQPIVIILLDSVDNVHVLAGHPVALESEHTQEEVTL